jgi:phage tail sheath gpL-like
MALSFDLIPTTIRTPSVLAEFSAIRAQSGVNIQPFKVLLIGQRIATLVRATGSMSLAGQPADGDQFVVSDGAAEVTFEFDTGAVAASGTVALAGQPADADKFIISDGATAVTFEFDSDSSVTQTSTLRQVVIGVDAAATRTALMTAINAASFNVTAGAVSGNNVPLTNDATGTAGNVAITEPTNVSTNLSHTGMSGGGSAVTQTNTFRSVSIGGSVAATLANLLAAVNATPSFAVTALAVSGSSVTLRNDAAGTDGNVAIAEAVNVSGNLSDTGMSGGAYTATGSAESLVPYRIGSAQEAANFWGAGSHLHRQALAFFRNNAFTELWGIGIDDPVSGVAASGTLTMSGTATASGTLYVYVGGNRYSVGVAAGDSASTVAAAIEAEVDADTAAPFTASASGAVVTFAALNLGIVGNSLDLRVSHNAGEVVPAGLTATIVGFSGGAAAIDLDTVFEAAGEEWFNIIVSPYTGTTPIGALADELESRWGPLRAIEAFGVVCNTGSVSTVVSAASVVNSGHLAMIPAGGSPTWTVEIAAAAGATIAYYAAIDPARPFNGLPLLGVLAPQVRDRLTLSQHETLLHNGVSTTRVDESGRLVLERVITTYRTNSVGGDDIAFLDATTHFTLTYLRYDLVTLLKQRYPRSKLANDDTRIAAGQSIVTPGLMRAEMIARAALWESLGLVEDLDGFKADLIVERNASDPTRLDFQIPPNLVNPLIVLAGRITFIL